jgi:hypothetical protein
MTAGQVTVATTAMVQCEEIPVDLRFDAANPLEVVFEFRFGGELRPWVLARQLLHDGLLVGAGEGDVRVERDSDLLVLRLRGFTDSGAKKWVTVCLPARDVELFLFSTLSLVPIGAEEIDMDSLVDALLGGAR